jgi:exonuclease III
MSDYKRLDSVDIFYQNVRGLRTKCTNFYDSACINDSKIICVTETWLDDSFCNRNLFPDDDFVFRTDRVHTDFSLTRGGGVLTAVHQSLSGCKSRYDLELTSECVWIEIPLPGGFSLLVGNHYFSPNSDVKVIENYFNSLEIKLNPQNFRVVLGGDFNVPCSDWANGFPQANSHYYTKIRGDVVYSASCYLGLSQ